ncbi:MAG TPA: Phenylacetic acid catabolic protein [Candidatus Thermoplasmatota archaeon]|nr:Phenylacetic acid catabolic protein [Candidatus Thermoplasmatota archaeon]
MAKSISTFEDWIEFFHQWQKDIQFDTTLLGDFHFEAKFAEEDSPVIEFGDYKGRAKWNTLMQVPNQQVRDALLNLIVYQGDTEFASVEQQRHLVATAPSDYDLKSIVRVMAEEQRHGWQMSYLLVNHFGDTGKVEAKKLLERRSWDQERLLGSFNEPCDNWLDFFVFTEFVDRDGKYQLKMLSRSAFSPLARSMGPMLKEEAFHLGTGHTGLRRILQAGKIPTDLIQRRFNKWVPTAFDLFGKDRSSTAHWAYVWGLKCRYDELETDTPVEKENLNDYNRNLYHRECVELATQLNAVLPTGEKQIRIPDLKFRRAIGAYADQRWTVEGEKFTGSEADWNDYLAANLPTKEDDALLAEIFKSNDWIAPKGK